MSASDSSPVPKLPNFVFADRLGSGTYATVYKAYRKGGRREVVAIKCVKKSSLNKLSTENLLTEIELLKTLQHDHIVLLKDFLWDAGHVYLIMEYCSGGDLSRLIKTHRILSEYLAKRLMQQLASALQYMRSKNVSHMDLKPQNILLARPDPPVLKIADFGFAHYLVGDIDAPHLRGSPLYMAPEIIINRHYNEKADLWSLGIILHECLFGRAPFASRSIAELKVKIVDPKPVTIPHGVHISKKVRHLLTGLLQRDPSQRMSFDEFLSHSFIDLEHIPSFESLPKAKDLIDEAVRLESEGEYKKAVQFYCKSFEYFIPAIHYESDLSKKNRLREKVKAYMNRAEELKILMKPVKKERPVSASMSRQSSSDVELIEMRQENGLVDAAVKVIIEAENKESQEDFPSAIEKYELALASLIKIMKDMPLGKEKEILQKHVGRWLTRAEEIKSYLEVTEMNTQDTSCQEEEDGKSVIKQCCIQ